MISDLADAVDTLDVPTDGEGLASVLALRDRLEAKIAAAVCAFDDTNEWDTAEGCASLGAWLRIRGRMTAGDAGRLARTARRLRTLPTLREAWLSGEVSGGHVATVVMNLNDRTVAVFRDQEDDLVPILAQVEVGAAAVAMKAWAAQARELLDHDPGEPDPDRTAHLSPTLSGGRLDANLEPEAYHAAETALRLAMGTKTDDDPRSLPQRRHDALAEVFTHYLDHQSDHIGGRHRPHLNITIGLENLIEATGQGAFDDGTPITAADARRLACDANIHRVITRGDSSVLDHGRATRTVSAALFMVLCLRDKGCRFPGCDRPAHLTDTHHIRHRIDHGHTEPDNLVLLCRHHHTVIHRPGWTIELHPTPPPPSPTPTADDEHPHPRTPRSSPPDPGRAPFRAKFTSERGPATTCHVGTGAVRVLLLEDEARLSHAFARRLRRDGFAVDPVATVAEARTAVRDVAYDCLVLDRHVPDGDAFELLAELTRAGNRAGVVVVSAHGDADARVQGLSEGADDYMTKPVRLDELALRVGKVVARRDQTLPPDGLVVLGSVRVDLARRTVTRDGEPVRLTPAQYSVFELLVRHRDRMLTTEEVLEQCWDSRRDLFSNPLRSQVTRLRKIFEGDLRIVAVRGAGYRLELVGDTPPG